MKGDEIMAKNVIVPTPIFSEKNNIKFILPIFLHLQIRQGRDGIVLTSLEMLLKACGYVYNRQSKNSGYIDAIKSSLLYLQQEGYIAGFYDRYGIQEVEDISTDRPKMMFTIEVNDDVMNYIGEGFIQVFIDDYRRIVDFSMKNSKHRLNKMLYLYCFISRYMFRRHKNFSDDARYDQQNREMAINDPNHYLTTYDRLSFALGDGFSRSSVITLMKSLEESGVIHCESIGYFISNGYSDVKRGGTVIVLDSKYWEVELEAAVKMQRNNKFKYYTKGEEATD